MADIYQPQVGATTGGGGGTNNILAAGSRSIAAARPDTAVIDAVGELGQGIGRYASVIADNQIRLKEQQDQIDVARIAGQVDDEIRTFATTQTLKVGPLARGITQESDQWFAEQKKEQWEKLGESLSERGKKALELQMLAKRDQLLDVVSAHQANEFDKERKNTANAALAKVETDVRAPYAAALLTGDTATTEALMIKVQGTWEAAVAVGAKTEADMVQGVSNFGKQSMIARYEGLIAEDPQKAIDELKGFTGLTVIPGDMTIAEVQVLRKRAENAYREEQNTAWVERQRKEADEEKALKKVSDQTTFDLVARLSGPDRGKRPNIEEIRALVATKRLSPDDGSRAISLLGSIQRQEAEDYRRGAAEQKQARQDLVDESLNKFLANVYDRANRGPISDAQMTADKDAVVMFAKKGLFDAAATQRAWGVLNQLSDERLNNPTANDLRQNLMRNAGYVGNDQDSKEVALAANEIAKEFNSLILGGMTPQDAHKKVMESSSRNLYNVGIGEIKRKFPRAEGGWDNPNHTEKSLRDALKKYDEWLDANKTAASGTSEANKQIYNKAKETRYFISEILRLRSNLGMK